MMRLPKTAKSTLTRDCFVTTIHAQTNQEIDEGHLSAGTLAKNVFTEPTEDGPLTHFLASTDGGKHWYLVRTYEKPADLFTTAYTDRRYYTQRKLGPKLSRVGSGHSHR